jgi:hypothetical protein
MMTRFATGKQGDWYTDCRDGKRRAVCHFRKLLGKNYIDKSEKIPPSQRWFEFFEYIRQTKEVVFQVTKDPTTDRRSDYIEIVFEAYDVKYDEVLITHSLKVRNPRYI